MEDDKKSHIILKIALAIGVTTVLLVGIYAWNTRTKPEKLGFACNGLGQCPNNEEYDSAKEAIDGFNDNGICKAGEPERLPNGKYRVTNCE